MAQLKPLPAALLLALYSWLVMIVALALTRLFLIWALRLPH